MTPLGTVIRAAMDRRGYSTREVTRKGGPSASTVGRLISPDPDVDRSPPNDDNLGKISKALGIPLTRLEAAAAETRGWSITKQVHNEHIEDVVAGMQSVSLDAQRTIADIVLRIVDLAQRIEFPPLREEDQDLPLEENVAEVAPERIADQYERAALKGKSRGRALREELDRQSEIISPPPDHDDPA